MRWLVPSVSLRLLVPAALAAALAACASQPELGPVLRSSADHPGYATRYPAQLEEAREELAEIERSAEATGGKLGTLPDELEPPASTSGGAAEPDPKAFWGEVEAAYRLAHEAGRSRAFVEAHDQTRAIATFWKEEKPELEQKVGGSVVYSAKQRGCSEPGAVGGVANAMMDKTLKERAQERLRERSPAHRHIDAHSEVFGDAAAERLAEQLDVLSGVSLQLYVAGPRVRERVQRMLDERDAIRETLTEAKARASRRAAASGASDAVKEREGARAAAAQRALDDLDEAVAEAEQLRKSIDERLEKAQTSYEERLSALLQAVAAKAR